MGLILAAIANLPHSASAANRDELWVERPQCQRQRGARGGELHGAASGVHDDPVEFYNLHGFWPDNLRRK
jgi:hypothetical protein